MPCIDAQGYRETVCGDGMWYILLLQCGSGGVFCCSKKRCSFSQDKKVEECSLSLTVFGKCVGPNSDRPVGRELNHRAQIGVHSVQRAIQQNNLFQIVPNGDGTPCTLCSMAWSTSGARHVCMAQMAR